MNTKFYAVVDKDNIVIDCGFDGGDIIISAIDTTISYPKNQEYNFIEMTLENSPAYVGMKYMDNQFVFEEKINA